MGETAVTAARAIDYHNAGTVEFLLDSEGNFYFLEMNTRLQVEHPVTEMVTGIDLVAWQIRVAEGEPLPLSQADVALQGHAIEARLYAENPAREFLPVTGQILLWREPAAAGIRVESGIQSGDEVSIYYDPMLAKIVAHGPDRMTAIRRLVRALETTTLLGLTHNLAFLRDVLCHPAFQAGQISTHFVANHLANWEQPPGNVSLALMAVTLARFGRHAQVPTNRGYWRNNPNRRQRYRFTLANGDGDKPVEVELAPVSAAETTYQIGLSSQPETTHTVTLNEHNGPDLVLTVDGYRQRVTAVSGANSESAFVTWWVQTRSGPVVLQALPLLPRPQAPAGAAGSLRAPMPGSVLAVLVEVGQQVHKGQALMKLEAMKMEHTIRTAADGVVEEIYFAAGDTVEADAQLLKIKAQ
jgi:acetyl/propionyl-CoA carboxylase alpha subunit